MFQSYPEHLKATPDTWYWVCWELPGFAQFSVVVTKLSNFLVKSVLNQNKLSIVDILKVFSSEDIAIIRDSNKWTKMYLKNLLI